MNNINGLTIRANSTTQDATIPSEIFLTYLKITTLMESRINVIYPGTRGSMSSEDQRLHYLFLAGRLHFLNEEYEKRPQNLPNPTGSSITEAPHKRIRVVSPEVTDPTDHIDFDDPKSLQKLFD